MNALVASVIRTYTPIIVGQVAAWLILIHVPIDPTLTVLLTAITGGILSGAYYTLIRVLEQQWPWLGALLGLTASPDTYSKGTPAADEVTPAAPASSFLPPVSLDIAAPAATFPAAKVEAAQASALAAVEPAPVAPVFEAPAPIVEAPVAQ